MTASSELQITTFYGTDGCGKTTIARELANQIGESTGEDAVVIGGSSYKEWLTRDIAKKVLGSPQFLDAPANTPPEKQNLYENIAITTYGFAEQLLESGQNVIIDSDPFLKRIVWSRLETPEKSDHLAYVRAFEKKVTDHIGSGTAPRNVIGINVSNTDSTQLLARIKKRGGVSEYDPQSCDEMIQMHEVVVDLWRDIKGATQGEPSELPGITERFSLARAIEFTNPDCCSSELEGQVRAIAKKAFCWVARSSYEA